MDGIHTGPLQLLVHALSAFGFSVGRSIIIHHSSSSIARINRNSIPTWLDTRHYAWPDVSLCRGKHNRHVANAGF